MAFVPYDVVVWAGDAKRCPRLGFFEVAVWVVSRVVGREVDDEIVGSRGNENIRERCGEVG